MKNMRGVQQDQVDVATHLLYGEGGIAPDIWEMQAVRCENMSNTLYNTNILPRWIGNRSQLLLLVGTPKLTKK